MDRTLDTDLLVSDISIAGYAQDIPLRTYRPAQKASLPIVLYFHGGNFTQGSIAESEHVARTIALSTPAWVVSVGYSLAPAFPFPAAPEDGYLALRWAAAHAKAYRADAKRIAVAGHDAGGNLATVVAAIARDRGDVGLVGQVMFAPLLDPSMTRVAVHFQQGQDSEFKHCSRCYRDYLPGAAHRLHPYAAPLESKRLAALPNAFIVSVQEDLLHIEAESYAGALIAAGVPTEVVRHANTTHGDVVNHPRALADSVSFLQRRFTKQATSAPKSVDMHPSRSI